MSITLTALEAAQTIQNLAGVSGDGTSNGALMSIVNRVILAASVILAGIFVVNIVVSYAKGGSGGFKAAMNNFGLYALLQGGIFAVWAIAKIASAIFGGFIGR